MNVLSLNFPPNDSNARYVRDEIREWAIVGALDNELLNDTLLVASELFSNAVRASTGATIYVNITLTNGSVTVDVTNQGRGFDMNLLPTPNLESSGGRGVMMIRRLGDLTVQQTGRDTKASVVMRSVG